MTRLSTQFAYGAVVALALAALSSCVGLPTENLKTNQELRKKAHEFPLDRYVPQFLVTADSNFMSGSNFYSNNNSKSEKALNLSKENYEKALAVGLPLYFNDKKAESTATKSEADSIKSIVSMRARYTNAQARYDAAVLAMQKAREASSNSNAVVVAGKTNYEFYPATKKNLSKKEREQFDREQAQRRDLLIEAAVNMSNAQAEFRAVHQEAKAKKQRSDTELSQALGDLKAVENRGKTAIPKQKDPSPIPDTGN
ncbi:MAG: hypothetical protein J0L75_19975 [Spirochaetes bacterium]|nr:hypothetical protein [Spirochaetota bacterium]